MAEIKNGLLIDAQVTQKIISNIERGPLDIKKVTSIIVHQTYSPTAESTIQDWATRKTKKFAAHFLVDTSAETTIKKKVFKGIDGKIYQTANLNKLTNHMVSKNYKKIPISSKNSIGIEFVAMYDVKNLTYPPPTVGQIQSGAWLIRTLVELITTIPSTDAVFAHGVISNKDPKETEGVSTLQKVQEQIKAEKEKPDEIKLESTSRMLETFLFPHLGF